MEFFTPITHGPQATLQVTVRKTKGRGVAITGLILSAVSLVFSLGMALWSLAFNPPAFQWHFNTF